MKKIELRQLIKEEIQKTYNKEEIQKTVRKDGSVWGPWTYSIITRDGKVLETSDDMYKIFDKYDEYIKNGVDKEMANSDITREEAYIKMKSFYGVVSNYPKKIK